MLCVVNATMEAPQFTPVSPMVMLPTNGVPNMLYAPPKDVKHQAMKIFITIGDSLLPIAFVSAMPHVHLGKVLTISTVFENEKYVCPNAVGLQEALDRISHQKPPYKMA